MIVRGDLAPDTIYGKVMAGDSQYFVGTSDELARVGAAFKHVLSCRASLCGEKRILEDRLGCHFIYLSSK